MKKIIILVGLSIFLSSCHTASNDADIKAAKLSVLDSVNNVNMTNAMRQRTIDSMNEIAKHDRIVREEHHQTSYTAEPEATKKKGMNNTSKGAIIGAGAGAVTGAVAGAVLSEDKGKGAVIGGIIGAATGAGVGAVSGRAIDKKKATK